MYERYFERVRTGPVVLKETSHFVKLALRTCRLTLLVPPSAREPHTPQNPTKLL